VNGWYFLKTDMPGTFSAYTRIVSDTAREGTKSQLFGYRTLNHLNGLYFEKKLNSAYKMPEFFSVYVHLNKIEPARILNTATFQFFLGNKDTMVAIERGRRGFGEKGLDLTAFGFLAFPQVIDSVDRMRLRFAFVTTDTASAELLFDKLEFIYDREPQFDSTLIVDRFGDPEQPPPPALLSPANGAMNLPEITNLVWQYADRALRYHLHVATDSLFQNLLLNDSTIATTSRGVGPLQNRTWHYWRVRAGNDSG
jgi:hypothetical protein